MAPKKSITRKHVPKIPKKPTMKEYNNLADRVVAARTKFEKKLKEAQEMDRKAAQASSKNNWKAYQQARVDAFRLQTEAEVLQGEWASLFNKRVKSLTGRKLF